ncbi:hypothetical protein [Chitinophaga qingshengii]|uniref:Uncharacterized protein n=1 Tax=Chitinophaga qingshengii TaxID=1569794 RepID=A0ABR7TQJ9_9BACT|nr:hypothetical protein [Chitinophaga qingshengii]MBC9932250.1 hypothetical protein [Chitinophaga qingshengii]
MQLTELKEDIFRRWLAASGEVDKIADAKAAVVREVCAKGKCYAVKNYEDGQIARWTGVWKGKILPV